MTVSDHQHNRTARPEGVCASCWGRNPLETIGMKCLHGMAAERDRIRAQRDRACQIVNARDAEIARMRSALDWITGYAIERNLPSVERRVRAALSRPEETTRA